MQTFALSGYDPATSMQFALKYDGPAVRSGRMSAREAGPAILGVGMALERASELLHGPDGKLNVEVRADFEHGSFIVDFDLLRGLHDGYELLGAEATKNVLAVLFGGGGVGAIGWIRKWKKGEALPPPAPDPADDGVIKTGGGLTIHMPGDNAQLIIARDATVQQGLSLITAPVRENPGVDYVAFYAAGEELERITEAEAVEFETTAEVPAQVSLDTLPSVTIGIAVVPLVGKTQWKFVYNDRVFPAPVYDEAWLEEARHIRFGLGDALRVEAEVENVRKASAGISQHWKILKVLEYIPAQPAPDQPASRQIDLLDSGAE